MIAVSFKKEVLKFLGFFLILYLIVFVVLNITGWLVRPKKIEPPLVEFTTEESQEKSKCIFLEKPDSISIPKIGIEAPLVFPEKLEEKDFKRFLDQGVVHYPASSLPGKEGETIFLGHSAPPGWPKIKYDWVFSDLNKLEAGDEIFIFLKNCQYTYKVSEKYFLEKGEELPTPLTNSKNVLILISCWPPGKDLRRIGIRASLIEE